MNQAKVLLRKRKAACCPLHSRLVLGSARQILVSLASRGSSASEPFMVMVVIVHRDGAAALGDGATHVLELNGGVADIEAVGQHAVDAAQNRVAGRRGHVVNQNVA